MRKALVSMLAVAAVVCACNDDLEDRMDSLETRVAALEAKVNDNASSIAKLIEAAANSVTVTSVVSGENGYTIYFSDGTTAVISDGKDGADGKDGQDGKDGVTPVIGVAESDGIYYWTVNGEFLLNNGQKVPVSGQDGKDGVDGKTPQFKIDGGEWYYSFDGAEWTKVPVSGTAAPQLMLTETADAYVFTYGETVITIKKALEPLVIKVQSYSEMIDPCGTIVISYTLSGADETTHVVIDAANFEASIDETAATVTITAPAAVKDGYVMLKAVRNSDSSYSAQYINIRTDGYGSFGGYVSVSDENEYLNW